MMRSMFAGVSGLRVHQTKMDVIANNIANVNTVAFKSSRVTFSEVFYQKLSGASGSNDESGRAGINAMQIGLGSNVASIDMNMTSGAMQRTDNWSDLMIDGDGFFIVGDNNGTYFTRAGAFTIDESGYLATPSGLKVMGWDAIEDPDNPGEYKVQKSMVKPIEISGSKEYVLPEASTHIEFTGNLNALKDPIKDNMITFFDSIGNKYVVDMKLVYVEATGLWDVQIGDVAYPDGDRKRGIGLTAPSDANPPEILIKPNTETIAEPEFFSIGTIEFDPDNGLPVVCTPSGGTAYGTDVKFLDITIKNSATNAEESALIPEATFGGSKTRPDGTDTRVVDNVITFDFSKITQFGTENGNATTNTKDGNAPGRLDRINIGTDGKITGGYTNGMDKLLGQIAIANFANPAGLEKVGDNLFTTTPNSGEFDGIGMDVQSVGSTMRAGVLEMSNVDLSGEFTEMITTQRGFQANSRVITTSDDMLQELVNLKR